MAFTYVSILYAWLSVRAYDTHWRLKAFNTPEQLIFALSTKYKLVAARCYRSFARGPRKHHVLNRVLRFEAKLSIPGNAFLSSKISICHRMRGRLMAAVAATNTDSRFLLNHRAATRPSINFTWYAANDGARRANKKKTQQPVKSAFDCMWLVALCVCVPVSPAQQLDGGWISRFCGNKSFDVSRTISDVRDLAFRMADYLANCIDARSLGNRFSNYECVKCDT